MMYDMGKYMEKSTANFEKFDPRTKNSLVV